MQRITIDYNEQMSYPVGQNMPAARAFSEAVLHSVRMIETAVRPGGFNELNIFCRGSSGSILATMFIAFAPYKCNLVYVKKEIEQGHSGLISDFRKDLPSLVIDDFMSSGETLREIYKGIVMATNNPFYPIDMLAIVKGYDSAYDVPFIPSFLIQKYH